MDPASFSIFNRLTEKQFEKLSKHFNILTFGANANIYQQTDTTEYVYGVMEGMVKTGIVLDEKKELIKRLVKPGTFFGTGGLVGYQRSPEFARSLNSSSMVLSVPVKYMRELMNENGLFLDAVVQMMAQTLKQAETRLEMLLTADVRTRIMFFLKDQIQDNNSGGQLETMVRFGLTQQDIAQMIGATRQTVAIILNEMRKENLIDFSRKRFVIK